VENAPLLAMILLDGSAIWQRCEGPSQMERFEKFAFSILICHTVFNNSFKFFKMDLPENIDNLCNAVRALGENGGYFRPYPASRDEAMACPGISEDMIPMLEQHGVVKSEDGVKIRYNLSTIVMEFSADGFDKGNKISWHQARHYRGCGRKTLERLVELGYVLDIKHPKRGKYLLSEKEN
jgi:hypothetical protein